MLQVIHRLPETTMDHEQEREGTGAGRKAQLSKLLRTIAVLDAIIEIRCRSFQDVAQASFQNEMPVAVV